MLFDSFLLFFIPAAFLIAIGGIVLRVCLWIAWCRAWQRQFTVQLDALKASAPPPLQSPDPRWALQVHTALREFQHVDALRRARLGNRQAELMSLVAQAGIPLPR